MSKKIYFYFFLLILIESFLIQGSFCSEKKYFHKCGVYEDNVIPSVHEEIPFNEKDSSFKRRMDSDGFKDFKIYLDLANLDIEIEQNNLTHYRDIYINSMNKAAKTLEKLIRVKPFRGGIYLTDEILKSFGIVKWDETKFGNETYKKNGTTLNSLGIDLIIFGKISNVNPSTLASAGPRRIDSMKRPFVGVVNINKNVDYSKKKSQEYLDSIILHEFTHILGFLNLFFEEYYHNIYWEVDSYGINRSYINSSKVLEVARKYYNCSEINGVALEEYGGEGTVGSHWEARILLGDYMNGYTYTEEQVISEFTLALLEDTGYYKPNYYTGGLMRYGKNKGCSFVKDSCVNKENHTINPYFENEYYDSIYSQSLHDSSCSSGRQSRTYYAWWIYNNLNETYPYYIYFEKQTYGGFGPADYCPVAQSMYNEEYTAQYTGQCNQKGNGGYGINIYYEDRKNYSSESLSDITGETYSDHSFCFLSSLFKENMEDADYFSSVNRAICYDLFCSEKSLTVQIHDDYIVCPRAGGKIEVEGYKGFFLCPDYNLMCSGTVLCNDMFECVEKESLVKESSYFYDYEIKTSQNLEDAYIIDADNITNYELSENATCPIYCKHCKKDQICVQCKSDYKLVGYSDSQKVECIEESIVNVGYYKSEGNIYYSCLTNCETCSDSQSCEKCLNGFTYSDNKCIKEIENCKEYDENGICKECNDNFGFNKTNRNECINILNFERFYTSDEGISYYPCNEIITDCQKCVYDNKIVNCYLCEENSILVNNENTCYLKDYIDNNKTYFYLNETHAKKCLEEISNCNECESEEKCIKCINDFFMVNNDLKKCLKKSDIESLDEYYLNEENTTYYSCENPLYNTIENCKKCFSNDSCYLCQGEYTFINGNKSVCNKKEDLEGKYILDPNDNSNYIKCSVFINNCDSCNSEQCNLCNDNYIFVNDNFNECVLKDSIEINFYFTYDNITYYSCKDNRYKDNEKCQELLKTTIPEVPTTIPLITTNQIIKTTLPTTILIVPTTQSVTIPQTKNIDITTQNIIPTTIITTQINKQTTQPSVQTTIIETLNSTIKQIEDITSTIPSITKTDIISTNIPHLPTTQIIKMEISSPISVSPSTQDITNTKANSINITTQNIIPTTSQINKQTILPTIYTTNIVTIKPSIKQTEDITSTIPSITKTIPKTDIISTTIPHLTDKIKTTLPSTNLIYSSTQIETIPQTKNIDNTTQINKLGSHPIIQTTVIETIKPSTKQTENISSTILSVPKIDIISTTIKTTLTSNNLIYSSTQGETNLQTNILLNTTQKTIPTTIIITQIDKQTILPKINATDIETIKPTIKQTEIILSTITNFTDREIQVKSTTISSSKINPIIKTTVISPLASEKIKTTIISQETSKVSPTSKHSSKVTIIVPTNSEINPSSISKIDNTLLTSTNTVKGIATTQFEKNPITIPNIKTTIPIVSNKPTTINDISTNTILTTIPNIIPTTIIKNVTPQVKEKVFFLLQVQIIDGKVIIFLVINFPITTNQKFTFSVIIYSSRNLRFLEQEKTTIEMEFYPKDNYNGNGDKIVSLISKEDIKEDRVAVEKLKNDEEIEVKVLNDNSEVLDTQKVEESINKGGVDYSNISEDDNNIIQYKIISASSGCQFSLIIEKNINQSNKSIELNFIDIQNNNNIKANCLLSSQNDKKIVCSLENEIDSYFVLEPFIDSYETEIITIVQKNTTDYLPLKCSLKTSSSNKAYNNKKSGLSSGAIVGIILAIVFAVVITGIIIIAYNKGFFKGKKLDDTTVINKFEMYPSTTLKI